MQLKIFHSIKEIPRQQWQKLQPANFPFSSYDFLLALEESESVGKRTGWYPCYFTAWKKQELTGALYSYIKTNSYGEYIFDWAWAEAWQRNGLAYYPKLTSAIPFTPATGPKVLASSDHVAQFLIDGCLEFYQKENLSTAHFLFISDKEIPLFQKAGLQIRKTYQFHWQNENYSCFDDFLAQLKQKKRKEIRRERKLLDKSLIIHELTGEAVLPYADLMYDLYLSTIDKKWSHDYLTREFFQLIFNCLKDNILLYLAEKNGRFIAGTLNFFQDNTLYGRYWGSFEDIPYLHFELCYYKPIEFAIRQKLELFEAGAQGSHKVQRGFIPAYTYSAHSLPDNELGDAVIDFLKRESEQVDRFITEGRTLVYKDKA